MGTFRTYKSQPGSSRSSQDEECLVAQNGFYPTPAPRIHWQREIDWFLSSFQFLRDSRRRQAYPTSPSPTGCLAEGLLMLVLRIRTCCPLSPDRIYSSSRFRGAKLLGSVMRDYGRAFDRGYITIDFGSTNAHNRFRSPTLSLSTSSELAATQVHPTDTCKRDRCLEGQPGVTTTNSRRWDRVQPCRREH